MTGDEARFHIQSKDFKYNYAMARMLYSYHPISGELHQKCEELRLIVKDLVIDNDVFRRWESDVNQTLKKLRDEFQRGGKFVNAFTTQPGKFLIVTKDGIPVPCYENAITAVRDCLASRGAVLMYDHWRHAIAFVNQAARFPREAKDAIVKGYLNEIYRGAKILFTIEHIKFAMGQIAVDKEFHSLRDYYDGSKWDGKDRMPMLAKDIMKLESTEYQIVVITKQLTASVRRVKFPGAKYEIVPLLISKEGYNKTTFIMVLYGLRNVLSEDILDLC
jgi:hypothetical protein